MLPIYIRSILWWIIPSHSRFPRPIIIGVGEALSNLSSASSVFCHTDASKKKVTHSLRLIRCFIQCLRPNLTLLIIEEVRTVDLQGLTAPIHLDICFRLARESFAYAVDALGGRELGAWVIARLFLCLAVDVFGGVGPCPAVVLGGESASAQEGGEEEDAHVSLILPGDISAELQVLSMFRLE